MTTVTGAATRIVIPSEKDCTAATRPVTRGARIVALTWIQSLVKDEGIREVLYDIQTAARKLGDGKQGVGAPEIVATKDRLYKAYSNLLRRSADI